MRRVKLGILGFAAAAGTFAGIGALAPSAHAADLVEVCITLNPRAVFVNVNGHPLIGQVVVGLPRTCVGV